MAIDRAIQAGQAFVKFTLDDKKVDKQLGEMQKRFKRFGKGLRNVGLVATAAGAAIVASFVGPIKAASKMQDTMNKFNVVFAKNSAAVKKWGDDFAAQVGRSEQQIASFLASSQDLFIPLGFEPGAATEMSKQITKLAIDLASFNSELGITDRDALRDLNAALTGSGEVMKKYGVIVSETVVKEKLRNTIGTEAAKVATNQQKVQARLNIIMEGTKAAQGDAIRSAGDFENQMKKLGGQIENVRVAIGTALLPEVTKFAGITNDLAMTLKDFVSANPALIQAVAKLGGALTLLGAAATTAGVGVNLLSKALLLLKTRAGLVGLAIGGILVTGLELKNWFSSRTAEAAKFKDELKGVNKELDNVKTNAPGGNLDYRGLTPAQVSRRQREARARLGGRPLRPELGEPNRDFSGFGIQNPAPIFAGAAGEFLSSVFGTIKSTSRKIVRDVSRGGAAGQTRAGAFGDQGILDATVNTPEARERRRRQRAAKGQTAKGDTEFSFVDLIFPLFKTAKSFVENVTDVAEVAEEGKERADLAGTSRGTFSAAAVGALGTADIAKNTERSAKALERIARERAVL